MMGRSTGGCTWKSNRAISPLSSTSQMLLPFQSRVSVSAGSQCPLFGLLSVYWSGPFLAIAALAVGFEKMEKGALGSKFSDRVAPIEPHFNVMNKVQGFSQAVPTAQMFGGAGREHRWKYGTKKETFGKISEKARKHAANNPYALFNQVLSLDEIMASDEVFDPLTRYQCCPPTCGAAAAILASDDFAKRKSISKPVYIAAQAMTTDYGSSFGDSMIKMVGYDMAAAGAKQVYEKSGLGPADVDRALVAGSFGYHLRTRSLLDLGLFPPELDGRISYVGNTSQAGARALLLNRDARAEVAELARRTAVVELADDPGFQRAFVGALAFPGAAPSRAVA